jgi:segregation and condensation protein B
MELKRRVEAVLFAAGRALSPEEIGRLCKESDTEAIRRALAEIGQDLEHRQSSLLLVEEGTAWKLTVRESYLPYVRRIVPEAELPKSILETLAVIAYKAPVLQSQIVKIRSTKAYDHLLRLEELGFITRERKGRTKLIKLTQKFYGYFDIGPDKLQNRFKTLGDLEQQIERKERELEEKMKREKPAEPEVALEDKPGHKTPLETYPAVQQYEPPPVEPPVEIATEKVGQLEVYQPPVDPHEHPHEHEPKPEAPKAPPPYSFELPEKHDLPAFEKTRKPAEAAAPGEAPPEQPPEEPPHEHTPETIEEEARKAAAGVKSREGEGLYTKGAPPEVEKLIQEKAERLLHPPAEEEAPKAMTEIELKPEQIFTPLPKKKRTARHEAIEEISAEEAERFAETELHAPPEAHEEPGTPEKDLPAQPPPEKKP